MKLFKPISAISFCAISILFLSACGSNPNGTENYDSNTPIENSSSQQVQGNDNNVSGTDSKTEDNRMKSNTYNEESSIQQEQPEEVESVDGLYSYEDNSAILTIRIRGNSWTGKTVIISGIGSDYDNQNAEYENGIVKGNDIYESSGMVKIGYVSGNSLTTSIGGQSVTLRK